MHTISLNIGRVLTRLIHPGNPKLFMWKSIDHKPQCVMTKKSHVGITSLCSSAFVAFYSLELRTFAPIGVMEWWNGGILG